MLMRWDPFRDIDRLAGEVFGAARTPALMPMDCLRSGDRFLVRFDMPGMEPDSLDVSAENNTLTVRGERRRHDPDDATYLISERPSGSYSRQLILGDDVDVEAISADYSDGVLTLTVPVVEQTRSRKIEIDRGTKSLGTSEPAAGKSEAKRQPQLTGTRS